MSAILRNWPKFLIGWFLCFGIRLLPFRPPNVEPILITTMPFANRFGVFGGAIFAAFSIILFDLFTSGIGVWTWVSAVAYAVVAIGAAWFFKNRRGSPFNYLLYAFIGTLFYDASTGLTIGPLVYGQPFMEALTGQIPFTLRHLLSNMVLAPIVSPLIDRWVVANGKLTWRLLWNTDGSIGE